MRFAPKMFGLVLALFLLPACQRLNIDRTITVESQNAKEVTIDGPRSEQQVSISVSSPDAPVDVYLILHKNLPKAQEDIPKEAIDKKKNVKEATFEATIPAKEDFTVVIINRSTKPIQAAVKATGR